MAGLVESAESAQYLLILFWTIAQEPERPESASSPRRGQPPPVQACVTNVDCLAAETAAFANSEGGVIYLGVADDGALPNNLTVAKIRAGNSIIRNPILVSYIAKGLLPYRGLGSGIKRALEDWPEIDFSDDRDANLFIATVHRKELIGSLEPEIGSEKSSEKSSEKILALLEANPEQSAREVAALIGVTSRAVEKQISRLRDENRIRRIGPAKGGYWEVME